MPRPITIDELEHHRKVKTLATFDLDAINQDAPLLRIYAAFLERVQKMGGGREGEGGSAHIVIAKPKTAEELERELKSAQALWDQTDKRYREIAKAEVEGSDLETKYKSYESYGLRAHAASEGYPQLATTAEKKS